MRWLSPGGAWSANGGIAGAPPLMCGVRVAADHRQGYAVTSDHSVQQYAAGVGYVTLFSGVACDLSFDTWGVPWFVGWTGSACQGVFYYSQATGAATQVYYGPAQQLSVGGRAADGTADLAVLLSDGTVLHGSAPCAAAPSTSAPVAAAA
ncbi:hypothetical protein CHLNCDRAFT_142665 [Chlorella variabilis]|uniref:Uncharacterized protein n=1 Tax=Chlorella variabilis TaxID=554065 RepID=E1ZUM9_CHLVA|nr:hypothetical protein CHLNCDRAFT_142665 [Chlorella variabilis]EFN50466.1 hypothetical protein CHLNCDRAFT_142665 [Chlorella variabilis]|eukprot:XP_005842598.1 hypothetical protein CHLNCDRAFT_142665 [Chlorella variabilis]